MLSNQDHINNTKERTRTLVHGLYICDINSSISFGGFVSSNAFFQMCFAAKSNFQVAPKQQPLLKLWTL